MKPLVLLLCLLSSSAIPYSSFAAEPRPNILSLVPLLKGEQLDDPGWAIFWHFPVYCGNKKKNGVWVNSPCSAIRVGDFKLIEFFEDSHLELYNLRDDIGETKDLAASHPDKARQLHAKLKLWQADLRAFVPGRSTTSPPTIARELPWRHPHHELR